jgi:hypothetical protein
VHAGIVGGDNKYITQVSRNTWKIMLPVVAAAVGIK